jgi:hypothetical protein
MDPAGPNIGHIQPAARAGSDHLANLGLEHRRCNIAAGARLDPPRAVIARPIEVDQVFSDRGSTTRAGLPVRNGARFGR